MKYSHKTHQNARFEIFLSSTFTQERATSKFIFILKLFINHMEQRGCSNLSGIQFYSKDIRKLCFYCHIVRKQNLARLRKNSGWFASVLHATVFGCAVVLRAPSTVVPPTYTLCSRYQYSSVWRR